MQAGRVDWGGDLTEGRGAAPYWSLDYCVSIHAGVTGSNTSNSTSNNRSVIAIIISEKQFSSSLSLGVDCPVADCLCDRLCDKVHALTVHTVHTATKAACMFMPLGMLI